jgi:nucleoside-diphosphate-sugar epimerase
MSATDMSRNLSWRQIAMKVFVTGSTGFIGSAVVHELLEAGHEVVGLARSIQSVEALKAIGFQPLLGNLEDLDSLRRGAADSDGVIHTAYNHDFTVPREVAAAADVRVIEAMGEALVGSDRPLIITSGTGGPTEDDPGAASPRYAPEQMALSFAERGVRAAVVRFPPTVHGRGDHGFIPILIDIARHKGVSAYPGDGSNRWAAVHRLDAAHLFRLAVQSAAAGARLHGVAEEGIPVREISEVIGRHLDLPVVSIPREEATAHFGFLGAFFALDVTRSSAKTRARLGWEPVQPGLITDLEEGHYFERLRAA